MKKPTITIASRGEEGNIFFILAKACKALRKAGFGQDCAGLQADVTKCGSYEEAIARIRRDVELVDEDGRI